MSGPALSLKGVVKRYGRVRALDGLDLELPRGSVCALVGPNGAGKTTTFGVVGGVVMPQEGQVDVLGEGPFDAHRHRGRVALLPQDCELNPHTAVRDLLVFYGRLQGLDRARAERDADRTLEAVDLRDRASNKIRQLSHGMRRRVAVAQAFIGDPELVLLDEPTSGLDPVQVARMRNFFLENRGQRTLLVSSHNLLELEQVCDHVIILDKGRCTRAGSMEEVTGRKGEVRIRVLGEPPLERLAAWEPHMEADWLVLRAPLEPAELNAQALPLLLEAGVGILEIRQGRGLERSYLEG